MSYKSILIQDGITFKIFCEKTDDALEITHGCKSLVIETTKTTAPVSSDSEWVDCQPVKPTVQMFSIYPLPTYAVHKTRFERIVKKMPLQDAINELINNDRGYHARIQRDGKYKIYLDIDKMTESKIEDLLLDLAIFFKIEPGIDVRSSDFAVTKNASKGGSFHVIIPHLSCAAYYQKKLFNSFITSCPRYKDNVDFCVYDNQWFRYPQQSKEGDTKVPHIITMGKMDDFMIENIEDTKDITDIILNNHFMVSLPFMGKRKSPTSDDEPEEECDEESF